MALDISIKSMKLSVDRVAQCLNASSSRNLNRHSNTSERVHFSLVGMTLHRITRFMIPK